MMLKKHIDKALLRMYKSIKNKDAIQRSNTYHSQKCDFYAITCECDCRQCTAMALGMLLQLQLTSSPGTKNYNARFVALYDCYLEFMELSTTDRRFTYYG